MKISKKTETHIDEVVDYVVMEMLRDVPSALSNEKIDCFWIQDHLMLYPELKELIPLDKPPKTVCFYVWYIAQKLLFTLKQYSYFSIPGLLGACHLALEYFIDGDKRHFYCPCGRKDDDAEKYPDRIKDYPNTPPKLYEKEFFDYFKFLEMINPKSKETDNATNGTVDAKCAQ